MVQLYIPVMAIAEGEIRQYRKVILIHSKLVIRCCVRPIVLREFFSRFVGLGMVECVHRLESECLKGISRSLKGYRLSFYCFLKS